MTETTETVEQIETTGNATPIESVEQITGENKAAADPLEEVINDAVSGLYSATETPPRRGRPSNVSKGLPPPKKKSGSKSGKPRQESGNAEPPVPDAEAIRRRVEAEMLVSINDAVLNALAGETLESAPELRAAYVHGIAGMLEEMGQPLPPWVQVAAVAMAYNARVLAKPTAKSRLIAGWLKVKAFFKRG